MILGQASARSLCGAMVDRFDGAQRLARLVAEIDELEKSRIGLLARVESLRAKLLASGDRTMAMRAAVDLLCDHISEIANNASEFSMLERGVHEAQQGLDEAATESSGFAFESDSLQETLSETDDDLESLNSLLLDRREKQPKGH